MSKPFVYLPPRDPIEVIHLDDDLLIVNKPSQLLSVPGKALEHADCLETRVKTKFTQALLVHRLDLDTSGVMVFAMNKAAQRHLGLQFQKRHIRKTYLADVYGQIEDDLGEIDLPLIVDWPNRPLQKICHETGKNAMTGWQVLRRYENHTRVRLKPVTGRSHQLRVHMMALGHPILGDRFYATGAALEASARMRLHAHCLSMHHPTGGERVEFECACPF